MASQWYCNLSGQQLGPLSSEQLRVMAQAGRLKPEDQVKRAGAAAWIQARELTGLFPFPPQLADRQRTVSPQRTSTQAPSEPPQLPAMDAADEPYPPESADDWEWDNGIRVRDDSFASDAAPLDFLAHDAVTLAGTTRVRGGRNTVKSITRQKYAILITAMAVAAIVLVVTAIVLVVAASDPGGLGADGPAMTTSPAQPAQVPSKDVQPIAVGEKPRKAPAQGPAPADRAGPKPAATPSQVPTKPPAAGSERAVPSRKGPGPVQNARGAPPQPAGQDPSADFGISVDQLKPGKPTKDETGPKNKDLGGDGLRLEKQPDRLGSDKKSAKKTDEKKPSPDGSAKPDSKKGRKKNLSEELFEKPLF